MIRPFPPATQPPGDPAFVAHVGQAALRVFTALVSCDQGRIPLSDYGRQYLGDHLRILPFTIQTGALQVCRAFAGRALAPGESCLVDVGAGLGIHLLIAKAAGIGTVVHHDHFAESHHDAQALAKAVGLPAADMAIVGDVDALKRACDAGLRMDAVISYDVLEHLYDVPGHLGWLRACTARPLRLVYTTSVNATNPRIRAKLKALQRRFDHEDRVPSAGDKPGDSVLAYRTVRAGIIRACRPDLAPATVDRWAAASRGLVKADMESLIAQHGNSETFPFTPDHPTTTCDPLTGNWLERLLEPARVKAWLDAGGYQVEIAPNYYGDVGSWPVRAIKLGLNLLASRCGRIGLPLAPGVTFIADLAGEANRPPARLPLCRPATRLPDQRLPPSLRA